MLALVGCGASDEALSIPDAIINPGPLGFRRQPVERVHPIDMRVLQRTMLTIENGTGKSFDLDLGRSELDGRIAVGPFFAPDSEGAVDPRYRSRANLKFGKSRVYLSGVIREKARLHSEGWTNHLVLALRIEFERSGDRDVATERRVHAWLRGGLLIPVVSIVEGPLLARLESGHPDWFVVAFETDRPARGVIEVKDVGRFWSENMGYRHEVRVDGLEAATSYRYRSLAYADGDSAATAWIDFRTAPRKGEGNATFIFAGDSRGGPGFGRHNQFGVNHFVLGSIVREARRHDPDFFLFGGDLVSGYRQRTEDLRTELRSWKQAILPLAIDHPVFSALGNHDVAVRAYYKAKVGGLEMDRWPYATDSGEAIFASELVMPLGAPTPRPGLPPYEETIYSFTHGPLRVIVFNNNYWWTTDARIDEVGGNPEGYLLSEQLEWIEAELEAAATDPAIRYVILTAQEPVWPVAGHASDATWHHGRNHRRAMRKNSDGELEALGPGMIEMRNHLWEMASQQPKVAAFFTSDEHNYSRTLITNQTPVGMPSTDDRDHDGQLEAPFSANPNFGPPLWHFVSGGAGAPMYGRENVPWNEAVQAFSTRFHYIVVRATDEAISITTLGLHGEVIDQVDDLMAARREE